MTGEPTSEIQGYGGRQSLLTSEAAASEAPELTHTFAHRALLLSLGCALLLALASTRAGAASAKASATISARLTATELVASQQKSIKLFYKLPAPSKSFTYKLSVKKGSTWLPVSSARKPGSSASEKRLSIGALFAGRTVKVGSYRIQLSCAGARKSLSFRISPFAGYLTKKSFTVAEARSIKLTYAFSKPSKSFAYRLFLKQGSKLTPLRSAKIVKKTKRLYLVGVKTASLKSLFGGKAFVVASYQLRISSAYSTRKLNFKIVNSADPATTGGSGTGTGSGNGSTGGADFTISGGVGGLEPGLTLPIELTLTNPNNTRIYVTRLTVGMSADSTPSGCDRDINFDPIIQSDATSTDPIAVPAKGKVTLTSAPRAPQITFRNLSTSQDVCKGKSFALTFSGSAHS